MLKFSNLSSKRIIETVIFANLNCKSSLWILKESFKTYWIMKKIAFLNGCVSFLLQLKLFDIWVVIKFSLKCMHIRQGPLSFFVLYENK